MHAQPLPDDIRDRIDSRQHALGAFGERPMYYPCVGSTNDIAARLAEAGAAEGTWVIADEQTAGRGRRGREWASPPGAGLYLSVVFRPAPVSPFRAASVAGRVVEDPATSLLTLMAGIAAVSGVRAATGLAPTLKWPNDLVVEQPGVRAGYSRFRKLAGILAEASATGAELQFVIVGIGINLSPAAYPPEVEARATSIEGELGRPADRGLVLVEVLAALAEGRRLLRGGRFQEVLQAWRALSPSCIGRRVRVPAGPHDGAIAVTMAGLTQGVDDSGALLVQTDAGVERIIAGDLEWE